MTTDHNNITAALAATMKDKYGDLEDAIDDVVKQMQSRYARNDVLKKRVTARVELLNIIGKLKALGLDHEAEMLSLVREDLLEMIEFHNEVSTAQAKMAPHQAKITNALARRLVNPNDK